MKTLKIPENMTEAQVLDAIEQAVRAARKFVFGYHGREDLEQEARLMAMDAVGRYSPHAPGDEGGRPRPLANFLCVHVRRRLCNFRRDHLRRPDAPCKECHRGRPCGGENAPVCERYARWRRLNDRKAAVMEPFTILEKDDRPRPGADPAAGMERSEALEAVDAGLPPELRADYLRMRDGARVPPARRRAVEEAVLKILKGAEDGEEDRG